jgi:hypothetical protein
MVDVAQLVRALDCGSRCRGFESHLPPNKGSQPQGAIPFSLKVCLENTTDEIIIPDFTYSIAW